MPIQSIATVQYRRQQTSRVITRANELPREMRPIRASVSLHEFRSYDDFQLYIIAVSRRGIALCTKSQR